MSSDNRIEQVLAYADQGNITDWQEETKSGIYDNTGEFTIYDVIDLIPYYVSQLGLYLIPYPELELPDSTDVNGYYYCSPRCYYSSNKGIITGIMPCNSD